MNDIAIYIFKKYGYKLNLEELNSVIQWYNLNKENIKDEEELDRRIRLFLYRQFPNKEIVLQEEDTSNMNYLLSMLKNTTKSQKGNIMLENIIKICPILISLVSLVYTILLNRKTRKIREKVDKVHLPL